MKIISSVEIRQFRSIKGIIDGIDLGDLNVFVGQNDNGKSNVLRALNLFFNGQTDVGLPFRFEDDYCYHASSGKGSRREVAICLYVEPPKRRFKKATTVRWTKKWKRDGSVVESREYVNSGESVLPKDNVSKWLDKLKYRYVPAIKGRDYFHALMGELHDVLNEAHSKLMASQGHGFISGIQKVTSSITRELSSQIGVRSTIQVPSDFKQLFSNLDFGERSGDVTYHLKQRGDGIKVRHIPVILKYMADQERNISIPGYVKPDTIWGFEEPENNLEMRFAFELAGTLKKYSSDIQILVTTHSPAFYSISGDIDVKKFYVCKDEGMCTGIVNIDSVQSDEMHERMGFLPVITPYLEEVYKAHDRIRGLERDLSKLPPAVKCCVLTEDDLTGNLSLVLEASGFCGRDYEVFSYGGKDRLSGAFVLAKYLKKKHPDIVVVVHRDRDYLSDAEVSDLKCRFDSIGVCFFCTNGVDVESYFLGLDHLCSLGLELSSEQIQGALNRATDAARDDSVNRFIDHVFSGARPRNNAYSSEINRINREYDSAPNRYRYGKKVLGLLKSELHKLIKKNVKIEVLSAALSVPVLQAAASEIARKNVRVNK